MSEPSPDIVEIAPDHDLVVQVTQEEWKSPYQTLARRITEFKVKKSVFLASSPTFDDCYHSFSGQEDKSPSFPLFEKPWKGTTIDALEIWLRAFHGNLNEASFQIAIPKVYDVMAMGQKYCFELKDLKPWFDQWYEKNKGDIKEQLLLLCWEFRHDKAFLQLSRFLVYHSNGRVKALKPSIDYSVTVPVRVTHVLNAVRGRLKNILNEALWFPIKRRFNSTTCTCKGSMVFYYQQAMFKKGVWPLEEHFSKTSVEAILTRLKTIDWSEQSSWGCKQCTFDCAKVIDGAVERTKKYFDGLCLDCMQDDAPSNEYGSDSGYGWKEKETWHCKGERHGEPTRYYSQMWANSREG